MPLPRKLDNGVVIHAFDTTDDTLPAYLKAIKTKSWVGLICSLLVTAILFGAADGYFVVIEGPSQHVVAVMVVGVFVGLFLTWSFLYDLIRADTLVDVEMLKVHSPTLVAHPDVHEAFLTLWRDQGKVMLSSQFRVFVNWAWSLRPDVELTTLLPEKDLPPV